MLLYVLIGLLWSKQFYHYIVESWVEGDPSQPAPPESRKWGRNAQDWKHLFNRDVVSMPDKWEYPWVRRRGGEGRGEKEMGWDKEGEKHFSLLKLSYAFILSQPWLSPLLLHNSMLPGTWPST